MFRYATARCFQTKENPIQCMRNIVHSQEQISKDVKPKETVNPNQVQQEQTPSKPRKIPSRFKFDLPRRLHDVSPSVWSEYSRLEMLHKPLNLASGVPNFLPPLFITDALAEIAKSENPECHQYSPSYGDPRLLKALAKLYGKMTGHLLNPQTEVLVTAGAYGALYAAILGHVDDGDEVIIVEPFHYCYEPLVRMAGGVPRFVPLTMRKTEGRISSADWILNDRQLESLFNPKTKLFILNTPHNPTGKMFNYSELKKISELCKKFNVLCLSDEVFEWVTYDGNPHIRMCTLPGMWDRTINIGSASKSFTVSGWQIGWAYGPSNLLTNLQIVHQICTDSCPTPLQQALAYGIELELRRMECEESYFLGVPNEMQIKRDYMTKFLEEAGFNVTIPEGGYFMLADWSELVNKIDISSEPDKYRDYKFTKFMTKVIGIQGIPPSAFYSEPHKNLGERYVRYCFIRTNEDLEKANKLLNKWKHK